MNATEVKRIIARKEPARLYDIVEPALHDSAIRDTLVDGSFEKNETVRYNCVRVLLRAVNREPALFYHYWERFAQMIDNPNGFHRSAAAQAIAYLARVDADCRLDGLLNQYLQLLDDSKVMVSHYFLQTLDVVYAARPDFHGRIVSTLLSIDRTQHPPARKELLKADVLDVLDRLFDSLSLQEQKQALGFALVAADSESPKTRKSAKAFAAKHSR